MPAIDHLTDWLCQEALPLWGRAGWDREEDTFVERLDGIGAPLYEVPRRVMVQARQIAVFCWSYEQGWCPQGAALARRAGQSLIKHFRADGHPGWAFSTDRHGKIIDHRRDLYAQAFVLLAFAALTRLDGRLWAGLADETLAFLDTFMATPEMGGYRESEPPCLRPRRQNPHMHLVEAMLALHEVNPDGHYLARAEGLLGLLQRKFVRGRRPQLVEFFTETWSPLKGAAEAFEPGHHFEWVWLLRRYAEIRGEAPANLANQMWEIASELGVAPDNRIYASVQGNGLVTDGSSRLWSLTEAAKAAASSIATSHLVEPFLQTLRRVFLDPARSGSWVDHIDARGRSLTPYAPASSLYHICCAAREIEKAHMRSRRRDRMYVNSERPADRAVSG